MVASDLEARRIIFMLQLLRILESVAEFQIQTASCGELCHNVIDPISNLLILYNDDSSRLYI